MFKLNPTITTAVIAAATVLGTTACSGGTGTGAAPSTVTAPPVTVTVSEPARVTVPDVVGKPMPEARAILEAAGLKVKVVNPDTSDLALAIWQDPAPGAYLEAGTTVTVTVK